MITVLYNPDLRSIFHTLYPLIISKYRNLFKFTSNIDDIFNKRDSNKIILIVRWFKGSYHQQSKNINFLLRVRNNYEKLIFLDDSDGADSLHVELLPFVDMYFKNQLLKDFSNYSRPMYGRQLFSDFYHREFRIKDDIPEIRMPLDHIYLDKLRLSWNLGASTYPLRSNISLRIFKFIAPYCNIPSSPIFYRKANYDYLLLNSSNDLYKRPIQKINARFQSTIYSKTIGYQRKIFLDLIQKKNNIFLTNRVNKKTYETELSNSVAVMSPFGWGEVCFRDFETLIAGALLIKPDMSHIKTYPDIYKKDQTYLSVDWLGNNLFDVIDRIINKDSNLNIIVKSGKENYFNEINKLEDRVLYFINEIVKSI